MHKNWGNRLTIGGTTGIICGTAAGTAAEEPAAKRLEGIEDN